ncbi:MAG TPA: hypothetical protein VL307_10820 [Chitinophagaceae bacterium]|nr:hypothetical protein [Chitinophagaceae bacterium]
MTIRFFCPRWGMEHTSWKSFLQRVKAAGYDGVECSLPDDAPEQQSMQLGLQQYALAWIGQHWQTVTQPFAEHQAEFTQRLQALAAAKPLFINSQTGKDYYTFEQNARLIADADAIAAATGIRVLHETHRGKFSFAAHIMLTYLQQLPALRITLDISHWCAVAETLLQDQTEAVATAIARTDHIHARIGHTQSAQVIDPRSPENAATLAFHLQCWDAVIEAKKKAGVQHFTITPEYGAPPYQQLLPFTTQPIADQWEINLFMMQLLKERYGHR